MNEYSFDADKWLVDDDGWNNTYKCVRKIHR